MPSITDQETIDIVFAVVTPPGYGLEVYIDATKDNPSDVGGRPTHVPSRLMWAELVIMIPPLRWQIAKAIVGRKMTS